MQTHCSATQFNNGIRRLLPNICERSMAFRCLEKREKEGRKEAHAWTILFRAIFSTENMTSSSDKVQRDFQSMPPNNIDFINIW